ncbi:ABC transporter permease [Corynebacterium halotolerans]|uniref:ABC transporter permease n=1 Tax=Corynebacterium halotolerans TaxID=225326 RepID=UPI003CEAAFCF
MKTIREPLSTSRAAVLGTIGVIGSGVVAEIFLRSGLIATEGLPIPSQVISGAVALVPDGGFWQQVGFTLGEWALGMIIATVVGVVLGGLMGAFTSSYIAFEWPVEAFRVLPSVALAPILVLLVGRGMVALSLAVALACVWPILLNTMYGVRGVDPTSVNTARTFGMSEMQILSKIKIPTALPFAFTGIRISASIGLLVAVSVELLVGDGSGIGGFILTQSANAANLDIVYAATLIAGFIGVIVNLVMARADSLVFAWKKGLSQ